MSADSEMTKCPHCGEAVEAASIICRFCYSGISKRYFHRCPFCAEMIRKNAVFCRFCKTEFEAAAIEELSTEQEQIEAAKFRETFLVEIGNLMTYSLGITDALYLIVNIVGRALQVSRCLIYCTYDGQTGWKYGEFCYGDEVQSCISLDWPAYKSVLVAKTVLAQAPLIVFGGQINSGAGATQAELTLLSVQSFLGVALPRQDRIQGCLILHQCDYHRDWTSDDINWIRNVADSLAKALGDASKNR